MTQAPVTKYAELFGASGAEQYAQYRPHYTPDLYAKVLAFSDNNGPAKRDLAVDIATGTGQVAVDLATHYANVLAVDGSPAQLKHANRSAPNVEYHVGDAHNTGLAPGCADLVTVAQALHWFEVRAFYREVRRVLKPGTGTLAAWTYNLPVLVSEDHPAQAALLHVYKGILGPYWDPRRRLVEQEYRGLEPSLDEFSEVQSQKLICSSDNTIASVLGYVSSWSSYNAYREAKPEEEDPLQVLERGLCAAMNTQDVTAPIRVHLKFTLLLAKAPKPL